MVAADTPAAPVITRLRDSFFGCIDVVLLNYGRATTYDLQQAWREVRREVKRQRVERQPNVEISEAMISAIAPRAAGVSASGFNTVKS